MDPVGPAADNRVIDLEEAEAREQYAGSEQQEKEITETLPEGNKVKVRLRISAPPKIKLRLKSVDQDLFDNLEKLRNKYSEYPPKIILNDQDIKIIILVVVILALIAGVIFLPVKDWLITRIKPWKAPWSWLSPGVRRGLAHEQIHPPPSP